MRFTVVLNTFNRAHFLPRALTAWTRFPADRITVVVADDGSEDGTDEVVREWGQRLPYRLLHVKHARQGHRRAEILNEAVEHGPDEAMLFTDADSLPAGDLLDVHARDFRSDRFLVGGYVLMGDAFTAALDVDGVARGEHESQLTPQLRRALTRRHWKRRFHILLRPAGVARSRLPVCRSPAGRRFGIRDVAFGIRRRRGDVEEFARWRPGARDDGRGRVPGGLRQSVSVVAPWAGPASQWRSRRVAGWRGGGQPAPRFVRPKREHFQRVDSFPLRARAR